MMAHLTCDASGDDSLVQGAAAGIHSPWSLSPKRAILADACGARVTRASRPSRLDALLDVDVGESWAIAVEVVVASNVGVIQERQSSVDHCARKPTLQVGHFTMS